MGTDGPPPRGADADQALLLAILSTLPARVFWKDLQSRYLGCNPAFAGDAGLASSADLVGRTDDELVWAAQARRYQADDAEVMGQGVPRIGYEEPQTTPGGGEIWLRTSKVPLRDRTGQVIGVLGMYEDITALRQARTRLERSEAALRRARDGVFWAGPDGEVQEVNRALCELLGRSAADLVGAPVAALMASMDPAAWQAQWQRLEEEGDVALDGTLSEPHTGGPLPVELTLGLVEVDQHRVAMGLVRDLRKRRALREQLQASEARFRALMEQSPTPTRLHAPDGRCLAENDAWRTLWGAGAPCPPDDNLWEDQGLTAAGPARGAGGRAHGGRPPGPARRGPDA
jgi:PAS domain S-box-containing protein